MPSAPTHSTTITSATGRAVARRPSRNRHPSVASAGAGAGLPGPSGQKAPRPSIASRAGTNVSDTTIATSALTAEVRVTRGTRPIFADTIEAAGNAEQGMSQAADCNRVAAALDQATRSALDQLAARITARLSQAPGLRSISPEQRPAGAASVPRLRAGPEA